MGKLMIGNNVVTPIIFNEIGSKYNVTINNIFGDIDNSGNLKKSSVTSDYIFNGVVRLSTPYVLCYKFYRSNNVRSISFPDLITINSGNCCVYMSEYCSSLNSISFPKLETISGDSPCGHMFSSCGALTSASFPELLSINGNSCCSGMFTDCRALTTISFPKLTSIISSNACRALVSGCYGLTTVSFPELTTISGNSACAYMFNDCKALTTVYFNSLTTTSFGSYTSQFSSMMTGTGNTTIHTIHFPSNLQSTISGLSGYPLFGGTSGYVTLSFDLPATS